MTPSRRLIFALPLGLLAACRGAPGSGTPSAAPVSPVPTSFSLASDGALTISGRADPGDRLLADGAPAGQADASGAWRLTWPQAAQARHVMLTAERGDRRTDAVGPLVLLPGSAGAVLLSPGGGARRLGTLSEGLHLLAIDYDSQGGMVVSGAAAAHADILVRVDSTAAGRGAAGDDGRFSIGLDRPVGMSNHRVEISGGAGVDSRSVRLSPATEGFNLQPQSFGWRLNWTTAAGGGQVTLLFDPPR
ncbi:MAG: hypothetical protein JWM33_2616 [Caulobacteraceae bacterium]|nr:hypothetical protein [Caulobacteraceae bacterium]